MQQLVAMMERSATNWFIAWMARAASLPLSLGSRAMEASPRYFLALISSAASCAPFQNDLPADAIAPVFSVMKPTLYSPGARPWAAAGAPCTASASRAADAQNPLR